MAFSVLKYLSDKSFMLIKIEDDEKVINLELVLISVGRGN